MSESILLDIQGQVPTITLNRPDRLNSFNPELHQVLQDALDNVESARPAVRILLLTGAGRGICVGQDLSDRNVAAARIRQAIRAGAENTLDERLNLERDLQREAGHPAGYREWVAAFMARRAPEFVGN